MSKVCVHKVLGRMSRSDEAATFFFFLASESCGAKLQVNLVHTTLRCPAPYPIITFGLFVALNTCMLIDPTVRFDVRVASNV